MVKGIGIDIADNRRFEGRSDIFLARIFTSRELGEAASRADRNGFLASRFAAKEAFAKAVGTGFRGFSPVDVEIEEDGLGRPFVVMTPTLDALVGKCAVLLSLSHEREHSVAMVVIDGQK